jgi:hypothetical protein
MSNRQIVVAPVLLVDLFLALLSPFRRGSPSVLLQCGHWVDYKLV